MKADEIGLSTCKGK